jgi:CRP-like cAMP-binding protein
VGRPSLDELRQFPLFAELDRKELRRIAAEMTQRTFPAGATIATEGEAGVGFFVIDDGRATVSIGGRRVNELGPGDHFGELSVILETPRTATVTAATELRCYGLTAWRFHKLVETSPSVSWRVLKATAQKLVASEQRDQAP